MDRRQKKTQQAIFTALRRLLAVKRFEHITVQEIIDEANVGRSTFYAHFETKDALLQAMCTDIFHHVFSDELNSEKTHDFSMNNLDLQSKLTHILYHFKDNEKDMKSLLASASGALFVDYFQKYLRQIFEDYAQCFTVDVPGKYLYRHLAASFVETVKWWFEEGLSLSPEEVSACYMKVIPS